MEQAYIPNKELFARVTCKYLNVRSKPEYGKILTIIAKDTECKILHQKNPEWSRVYVNGIYGFVMTKFLEVI